jgi:hypothetical protein
MTFAYTRLACAIALGMATVMPASADSLASSASSAASESVGSLSDSLRGSSNSSNKKQVAEGDYRIIDVAAIDEKPGMLRLKMQAVARAGDEGELYLDLPQKTLAAKALAAGDVVSARQRPYGYEFARADTREAFFLVLADDWRGDLEPRPVAL